MSIENATNHLAEAQTALNAARDEIRGIDTVQPVSRRRLVGAVDDTGTSLTGVQQAMGRLMERSANQPPVGVPAGVLDGLE